MELQSEHAPTSNVRVFEAASCFVTFTLQTPAVRLNFKSIDTLLCLKVSLTSTSLTRLVLRDHTAFRTVLWDLNL